MHSCEKKFFACYTDKEIAQEAISTAQAVPRENVLSICNSFCDLGALGELRRTSNCSDAQCSQICQVLGTLQDDDIEQLIEQKNFSELGELCQLGVPVTN